MSLVLGYNTSGFAHHALDDALAILGEIGYRAVGLTLDVHHAPPGNTDYARLGERLSELGLLPVVETGARFLLDPRRKHRPTLMDDDGRRRDFLLACVDIAATIGAPCVSVWSGAGEERAWGALLEGLGAVCDAAEERGLDIAFEPEPGMLVDTMERFDRLREELDHPRLRLTLDVGHLHCLEDGRPEDWIGRYASLLANVHLDDHRRGVHDHLMFGEGEIDWPPVMAALRDLDVVATVELSRHSHAAVDSARRAFFFLTACLINIVKQCKYALDACCWSCRKPYTCS